MPINKISEPIYQTDIHFIFDMPQDKTLAYLKKYFIPMNLDEHWEKAGIMYNDDPNYFIIIPDKKPKWDVSTIIAHESLHVASKVLRGKGIKLSDESEEAFTYYQTWILQSLLDIYNKHKRKSKR